MSSGAVTPYAQPEAPKRPVVSERSRGVALVLSTLLGFMGGHQFYAGKTQTGILMALTLGGAGLWWVYDVILVAAGEFRDVHGRRISRWSAGESDEGTGETNETRKVSAREVGQLADQVDALRAEVSELAERVEFAERLLAQRKERQGLLEGDQGRR